jgi:hypothetical protein
LSLLDLEKQRSVVVVEEEDDEAAGPDATDADDLTGHINGTKPREQHGDVVA